MCVLLLKQTKANSSHDNDMFLMLSAAVFVFNVIHSSLRFYLWPSHVLCVLMLQLCCFSERFIAAVHALESYLF